MSIRNNKAIYTYYKGYEGEPELILTSDTDSIHIWDGYIYDIVGDPISINKRWIGLTRDYHEMTGPYADDADKIQIDVKEYISDLNSYIGKDTEYEETPEVLEAIINWLNDHTNDKISAIVG